MCCYCKGNTLLRPDFLLVDFRTPPTVIFRKDEEKSIFFLFYPPTLNIICFVEKIICF